MDGELTNEQALDVMRQTIAERRALRAENAGLKMQRDALEQALKALGEHVVLKVYDDDIVVHTDQEPIVLNLGRLAGAAVRELLQPEVVPPFPYASSAWTGRRTPGHGPDPMER